MKIHFLLVILLIIVPQTIITKGHKKGHKNMRLKQNNEPKIINPSKSYYTYVEDTADKIFTLAWSKWVPKEKQDAANECLLKVYKNQNDMAWKIQFWNRLTTRCVRESAVLLNDWFLDFANGAKGICDLKSLMKTDKELKESENNGGIVEISNILRKSFTEELKAQTKGIAEKMRKFITSSVSTYRNNIGTGKLVNKNVFERLNNNGKRVVKVPKAKRRHHRFR